jgi:anti-anti-sigma factor
MLHLNVLADDGDAVHVRCEGSLSQQHLPTDVNPLERLLGPTAFARRVRLNLEHVEFLDSNGIGWLIECHKRFRKGGGSLSLCALPPRIMQVLRFCSMDRYFHLIRDGSPGGGPA